MYLAGIVAVGLLFRIHNLEGDMWVDETTSAAIARLPWNGFVHTVAHGEINMVLYYLFLKAWVVFGDSEFFLRLPSVIFSTATIPIVAAAARRLFGSRVAILSAALLALNTFHIYWGQQVRAYALQVFFLAVVLYLWTQLDSNPGERIRVSYVTAAALAVYAHLLSILAVAAHEAAAWLILQREPLKKALVRCLWVGALVLPVFVLLEDRGQASWIPEITVGLLKQSALALAGSRTCLVLLTGCSALGLLWISRAEPRSVPACRAAWAMVACAVAPVAILICLSLRKPLFVDRYLNMMIIPFVLLASLVALGQQRVLRNLLIVLLLERTCCR